jgi:hypothetical protein
MEVSTVQAKRTDEECYHLTLHCYNTYVFRSVKIACPYLKAKLYAKWTDNVMDEVGNLSKFDADSFWWMVV